MELTTEIAVLLGALIGGGISILTAWLQRKTQISRDMARIARSAKSETSRKIKIRLITCFLNVLQYQQYDIATPEQRSVFP